MDNNWNFNEIDLHGLEVLDAKNEILDYIEACFLEGLTTIRVIHGYNSDRIKRYIYSQKFRDFNRFLKTVLFLFLIDTL